MTTQQLDVRPQEGFNEIFTYLLNNEISNPPYNMSTQSKYFFFKKREWILISLDKEWYDFLDYDKNWFLLTRKRSDNSYSILDSEWNEVLNIPSWWTSDIFVSVIWWQTKYDDWTATWWSLTTVKDTNKSRADNELAWYYVYIEDNQWAWQLRLIQSNTSDTITVWWFDVAPASGSTFKVYDNLWDNVCVPYANWCYVYDWTEWVDRVVFSWFNIEDMVIWNSRLWFVSGSKVYYSEEWDYYYSPAWDELYISNTKVNNLFPYWDYIITTTPTSIWLIYKWFSTSDWKPFFVVKEWVSQIWVRNRFAIWKYKNIAYFIWSDERLYSLWVDSTSNSKSLKLTDNWTMPSQFISKYTWQDIKIYSDVNYIYLYTTDWVITSEIYYTDIYKGWLNNQYSVPIYKKKLLNSKEYILWKDWYWFRWWYSDAGNDYWQVIRAVVWEPDIWLWKNIKYANILLGKTDYIQNWKLKVTSHIWNKKIIKYYDLANSWYISDIWDTVDWTLWWTLMWYPIIWWDLSTIYDNVSDVDILQVGLNITWQLIEFEFKTEESINWLFLWGIYVYYNSMNPKMKYYKNII